MFLLVNLLLRCCHVQRLIEYYVCLAEPLYVRALGEAADQYDHICVTTHKATFRPRFTVPLNGHPFIAKVGGPLLNWPCSRTEQRRRCALVFALRVTDCGLQVMRVR